MLIEVRREWMTDKSTTSRCYIDGLYHSFMLERPWLNNQPEISCIPEGEYDIGLYDSPHFGRVLPHVLDVPAREYILIHPANWPTELKGCLAPGMTRQPDAVFNSKIAFEALFQKIKKAMDSWDKVRIRTSHV